MRWRRTSFGSYCCWPDGVSDGACAASVAREPSAGACGCGWKGLEPPGVRPGSRGSRPTLGGRPGRGPGRTIGPGDGTGPVGPVVGVRGGTVGRVVGGYRTLPPLPVGLDGFDGDVVGTSP